MIDLLGQILQYIWEFIPRPVLIKSTEVGVSVLFGRWPRVINPRLTIVWPLIEEWAEYPVIQQTIETPIFWADDATTQTWQMQLAVDFVIGNALTYHKSQQDGEQLILAAARGLAGGAVTDNASETVLCDRLSKQLSGRGIVIQRVRFVSLCRFRLFKLAEPIQPPPVDEEWC